MTDNFHVNLACPKDIWMVWTLKNLLRSLLLMIGLAALPACAAQDAASLAASSPDSVATQPSAVAPARIARSQIVVVHFDTASDEIRAGAMQTLHGAAMSLRGVHVSAVRIVGHTDASGRRHYNQLLSERRALAVADQLRKLAVQAPSIDIKGMGESQSRTGKARRSKEDRRVEIVFEYEETIATSTLEAPASSRLANAAVVAPAGTTAIAFGHQPAQAFPNRNVAPLPHCTDVLAEVNNPTPKASPKIGNALALSAEGWPSGLRQRS
ncbi:MAG TPA: OmpA family protein [Magnetospirillum sp.]|nr:OmpA family protein [Magnetospirillum sp.]